MLIESVHPNWYRIRKLIRVSHNPKTLQQNDGSQQKPGESFEPQKRNSSAKNRQKNANTKEHYYEGIMVIREGMNITPEHAWKIASGPIVLWTSLRPFWGQYWKVENGEKAREGHRMMFSLVKFSYVYK